MDCQSHYDCQRLQGYLYCDLVYYRCESCNLLCRNSLNVECRTNCGHFLESKEKEVTVSSPTFTIKEGADIAEDGTSAGSLVNALYAALVVLLIVVVSSAITFILLWCRNARKTPYLQRKNIESEGEMRTSSAGSPLLQGNSLNGNQNGHLDVSHCNEQKTTHMQKPDPPMSSSDDVRRSQNIPNLHQEEAKVTPPLHQTETSNDQCKNLGVNAGKKQDTKVPRQKEMSQNNGIGREESQCRKIKEKQAIGKVQNINATGPQNKSNSVNNITETTFNEEVPTKRCNTSEPGHIPMEQKEHNINLNEIKVDQQDETDKARESSQGMAGSRQTRERNPLVTSYGTGTIAPATLDDEGYGPSPNSTPHSSGERHRSGGDLCVDTHSDTAAKPQPEIPTEKVTKPAFVNRKFIYDYLRKAPWVDGYFSAGDSIEVYVDLKTITERWALSELTKQTYQQPNLFHIKHTNEQY